MSAPSICPCRFCEEKFTSAGITNHERWCEENPERGMCPDRAEELGLLNGASEEEATPSNPDPDQSAEGLPPREEIGEREDKDTPEPADRCGRCGGETIPAHQAREECARQIDGTMPDGLAATFDAAEEYCPECYAVSGGLIDQPWPITEGFK